MAPADCRLDPGLCGDLGVAAHVERGGHDDVEVLTGCAVATGDGGFEGLGHIVGVDVMHELPADPGTVVRLVTEVEARYPELSQDAGDLPETGTTAD